MSIEHRGILKDEFLTRELPLGGGSTCEPQPEEIHIYFVTLAYYSTLLDSSTFYTLLGAF